MGLETGTYLNDLVTTNPDGAVDPKSAGDDHLRLIKSTLKATFPGMAGAAWRTQSKSADYALQVTDNMTELNFTAGATVSGTAATLGNGFICLVDNNTSSFLTLPGPVLLAKNQTALLTCNGSTINVLMQGNTYLIDQDTVSTAASVTLTGLTTTYKYYRLTGTVSNSVSGVEMRLRAGAGSVDTGSVYYYVNNRVSAASGSLLVGSGNGATYIQIGGDFAAGGQTNALDISLNMLTTSRLTASWNALFFGASVPWQESGAGVYNSSGTVDRVQILPASGTISGTFYLYGIR